MSIEQSNLRQRGPALYPIPAAAQALGVGRTKLLQLIAEGEIRSVHIGRRHLVPAHEIGEYVQRLCLRGE
jgi:excisionase family DNA binding protein